jgi:peptidoglycan/LPS O-acetylase OafA/YrhL
MERLRGARQLDSLQVLRGFAALGVVSCHALRDVTVLKPLSIALPAAPILGDQRLAAIGAFGVDIFFILSGFLMIFIAAPYVERRKPVVDFIAHRLIRIWPLYVLATLLICAVELSHGVHDGGLPFDFRPRRLLSFMFIPSFDQSGTLQPILGPGWTLNYEMLFYGCFAAALLAGRTWLLRALAVILISLFAAGCVLPGDSVAGRFLDNSILFEFFVGAVIASAFLTNRLPAWRAEYWLAGGILLLLVLVRWPVDDGYRLVTRGVPAAMLFIGMLRLEGKVRWPRGFLVLGDASYSIYLIHISVVAFVATHVLEVVAKHGDGRIATPLALLLAVVAAIAAGLLCYRFIETPMLKFCRAGYRRVSAGRVQAGGTTQPTVG